MKIMCPYTPGDLHPETEAALNKYAPDTEFVDVSGSGWSYWRAVKERWTGTSDLVVIEQDIVIDETTIPSFAKCTRQWCTYAYQYDRGDFDTAPGKLGSRLLFSALGCTRFTGHLQKNFPLEIAYTPEYEDTDQVPGVPWFLIDYFIELTLIRTYRPDCHGVITHHQNKRDWRKVAGEVGFGTMLGFTE